MLAVDNTISAPDASLDIVFHWSLFTHLYPAECFLYVVEAARALKPGGRLMFSFLELEDPAHDVVWQNSLTRLRCGEQPEQPDVFLHRDWIRLFVRQAGFGEVRFVDGADGRHHPPF